MKFRLISLLIFTFLLAFFKAGAHPYHVSIAEVKYNSKNQALEIALKVFTDDLEKTLSDQAKKPVVITRSAEVQKLLETYLKQTVKLELSPSQTLPQRFIGFETQDDAQWLYLEIPVTPEQLKKVNFRNQLLMETYADQMNLVNLEISGQKKTLIFKQGDVVKPLLL